MDERETFSSKYDCPIVHLSFGSDRRMGVEFEVNSFDGLSRPADGNRPKGIEYVADVVAKAGTGYDVEVRSYMHVDAGNNPSNAWIVKPDSSCGMEINSGILRCSWQDLKKVLMVVNALKNDDKIKADNRCSVHIHIEISDLSKSQIASVIAWWVKCEPVIMDAMPINRKRNRYCQLIGINNQFQHDGEYSSEDIIRKVGDVKYYSLNTNQYCISNRPTLEFRTMEAEGVKDPYLVKQWIRFVVHFIEMTKDLGHPLSYHKAINDDERNNHTPWTGFSWLDPNHVLGVLGFNNVPTKVICGNSSRNKLTMYSLSNGMRQTRNWFLARLMKNMSRHDKGGLRYYANQELDQILQRFKDSNEEITLEKYLSPTELVEELVFGEDSII